MLNWIDAHPILGFIILAWTLTWKGYGLWKAANLQQKWWFIAIFLINTFGILEIVYLFFIARKYKVEVIKD